MKGLRDALAGVIFVLTGATPLAASAETELGSVEKTTRAEPGI